MKEGEGQRRREKEGERSRGREKEGERSRGGEMERDGKRGREGKKRVEKGKKTMKDHEMLMDIYIHVLSLYSQHKTNMYNHTHFHWVRKVKDN